MRVALEDPAVGERERVVALGLGRRVQLVDLRQERVGVGSWPARGRWRRRRRAPSSTSLGHAPHLDEPAVVAGDAALDVDHEDAVGGRVEGGVEQRQRVVQLGLALSKGVLGSPAIGDVLEVPLVVSGPPVPARVTAPRPFTQMVEPSGRSTR